MAIPKAVSPSVLTPGLYLLIDLLAGASSPSSGELRVALLASKSSAGNITNDTEVRAGGGESSASLAYGPGTPGHLAAKRIYAKYPLAQVDFIAPVPGAGTATLNLTVSGAPSVNTSILIDIAGRSFEVPWNVGEAVAAIGLRIIDYVTQRNTDLPVAAVTGGTGIATINSKVLGRVGNDIKVKATISTATGTAAVAGALTYTALSGGTTDPDVSNALTAIQGKEYAFIVPVLSNTDAVATGALSNVGRCINHINNFNSGRNARLQQLIIGVTSTISAAKAAAVHANGGQNSTVGEYIVCQNARGLPGELAGREVGGWLLGLSVDPAVNRIGELMDGFYGAADKIADQPADATVEDALGHGISVVGYTAQGLEFLIRAVTTYSQDASGGSDRRLLDVQNVSATYIVARDMRSALPAEFPQAKVVADTPEGDEPPPEGVLEERDIKSFVITRLRFWQRKGVITKASLDASIADGTLIVQVDESDATQVNIVLPFKIVQPLAKIGVVVQRQPN